MNLTYAYIFLVIAIIFELISTSLLKDTKRINSTSFKIGTVRLLNNGVENFLWNELEEWVKSNTKGYSEIFLLGTGGNINKLHKLANIKDNSPITLSAIKQIYYNLKKFNYEERIVELGLKPDRSDVIIPATELFLKIFMWSGAKFIYVPRAGLSDGMIRELYKTKVESLKV